MKRLLCLALFCCFASLAQAQGGKFTRIFVGFPAGQATDLIARLLAERLGPPLGETVIVENRPGQGGSAVLAQLAKMQPDGANMVLAPLASMVVNPHLYKSVGYDTLKDFEHIALVADLPLLLVATPSLPAKTLPELIAYAKANPDKLTHSSSGVGTLSHLGMEELKRRAGITILHVPYQGSPRAMADLAGGVVQVALDTITVTRPLGVRHAAASRKRLRNPSARLHRYAHHSRAGFPRLRSERLAQRRHSRGNAESAKRAPQRGAGEDCSNARDSAQICCPRCAAACHDHRRFSRLRPGRVCALGRDREGRGR
jgi:Tripartite tricarboxylate transporter family receptor